jgi:alcohol dehydrogenase class IV
VLDPAATLETPEWLLYSTGIRAVDHAVETYCSPDANLATEVMSLRGLNLLTAALKGIRSEPLDLRARMSAQFGMWLSIAPYVSGVEVGASHGIGAAIGAAFGIPHGQTSCLLLPAVLRWNAAVNADRQRALSSAMGAPDQDASDLVAKLVADLEQPKRLSDCNIRHENFEEIARRALAFEPVRRNPRAITTVKDIEQILELAS